jgi:hypothetical protein
MKKWIFIIVTLLNIQIANSTILYVKFDATGIGNGSSWSNAYITLQEALNVASSGYEIWVARGTYLPTFDYGLGGGSRYYHFRMIDGVAIYGGFAGTETAISQRNNYGEGEANETILSGDLNSNGLLDNNDVYHIFYHPSGYNLSNTAVLSGFTITLANNNRGWPNNNGGAIFNNQDNKTPLFEELIIKLNYADFGSAIYNYTCSPILKKCILKDNLSNCLASDWSSNIEIYNSIIYNNSGSALTFYQGSNPVINNLLIYDNTSVNGGGAIYFRASCTGTFNNVTITNNNATIDGGGISVTDFSTPVFNNCIIYGNTAPTASDVYITNNSSVTLNYSNYNNTFGKVLVDSGCTFTTTNNNITSDPLFVDLANDDYRLSKTSPCLDAGNNSYNSETYDIRGDYPRKLYRNSQSSGTIDIGAYEFRSGYDAIVITTNSASNIETDVAISGAELFADLFTPIIAKGIVWDTLSTPTISLSTKTNEGTTNGLFTSSLSGLKSNTTYYVRTYVTNGSGTTYGDEISFTTLPYGIDEDGNQDGVIDTVQVHVYNYYDENSGNYITIESLEKDTIYDVSNLTVYEDKYQYPFGLMSFKIKASLSNIKIYYHGVSSLENYTYRKQKLDGTFYDYTRATFFIQTINGNPTAVVTLRLQDGKKGDLDNTVNGIIYDPGGPAISTVAIPTLSEWARIILLSSFVLFGIWRIFDFKI